MFSTNHVLYQIVGYLLGGSTTFDGSGRLSKDGLSSLEVLDEFPSLVTILVAVVACHAIFS